MNKFAYFQIALKFAEKGYKVIFFTRRQLEHLPIDDDTLLLSTKFIRHIIFRYANTVDELRLALLELPSLTLAPRLLLIDSLQEFFVDGIVTTGPDDYANGAIPTPDEFTEFCEAHCIITAALQNAVDSMSCRLRKTCASIISIDFDAEPSFGQHYERFRTNYFKLYYFDAANRYHANEDNMNALQQTLLEMLHN